MHWLALVVLTVVVPVGCALAGVLLCISSGHAVRPRPRARLSDEEETSVALISFRWAALPTQDQTLAIAHLLRATPLRSKSLGATLRDDITDVLDQQDALHFDHE